MDGEQDVLERAIRAGDQVLERHLLLFEGDLARERVAVCLEAGGGQADEHVARADLRAGDDALLVDDADDGADEVVLALRIEAGHLGGFAAEQRAAVFAAGLAHALDDAGEHRRGEMRRADVVEEEQRRGALREDVVDAVVDEALPDRVVAAGHVGDLELRAHAVRGGDEHLAAAGGAEESAEAADFAEHAGRAGAGDGLLDGLEAAVHFIDVDAGGGVGGLDGFFRVFFHRGERASLMISSVVSGGAGDCEMARTALTAAS